MFNPSNQSAGNFIDNDIDNAKFYGMDHEGLSPFESSDNNAVIAELNLNHGIEIMR